MRSSISAPTQLRLGGIADADAIRTLTRAAYAPWVTLLGREPLPMTADYDAAVRAHRFDLAYRGGELVGLIETRAEGGPPAGGQRRGRAQPSERRSRPPAAGARRFLGA